MSIVKKLFLLSAVISIILLHSISEAHAGADDVTITLGDSSGGSAFQVQDSGSTPVFQVDSLGSMTASVLTITGTATVTGTVTAGNFSTAGTVTAAGFIGDGSQLTNTPAGGAGSVNSSTILDGTIALVDLATNIDFVTTGTLSVGGGNFVVDGNGSMTAAGTITAAGIVAPASGDLSGNYPSPSVINDSHSHTASTISGLSATDFISNVGSITATTITATGSITVSGTATVGGNLNVTGTITVNSAFSLPTTAGTNNQILKTNASGIVTWQDDSTGGGGSSEWQSFANGSITVKLAATNVGIGTTTPGTKLVVGGTATVSGNLEVQGKITGLGMQFGSTAFGSHDTGNGSADVTEVVVTFPIPYSTTPTFAMYTLLSESETEVFSFKPHTLNTTTLTLNFRSSVVLGTQNLTLNWIVMP